VLPGLTTEQQAAVGAPPGPLLIVAGPGSGKTLVLAARVAYLIRRRGIPAQHVLALTFAARAAQELRARLVRVLDEPGQRVDVATFHSLGLRLIRQWPAALGLAPGAVSVLTSSQATQLLHSAAHDVGLDLTRWSPAELAASLEQLRRSEDGVPAIPPWSALLTAYEGLLRRYGAVDYPAMLTWPLRLFREQPETLRLVRDRYQVILCDEAQDCCLAQYRLVQQLAATHRQLVLVGDPRQSIYAWRGADGQVLQRFGVEFPERRVVRLAQNFRSSGQIVAFANALGAPLGAEGPLWTTNSPGEPVRVFVATDEEDEAGFVAAEIRRLLRTSAVAHAGEIAVLYRLNQQREVLARTLRQAGAPVQHAAEEATVWLSTIHQAKGAEWPVVFLVGMEERLLPHYHAIESGAEEDLLAELRLAFVAVTRPRMRLYLTCCRQRRQHHGRPAGVGAGTHRRLLCRPSRFLTGLPAGLLARAA
jgi:DNA helicase-2/ATP-dependent DNA helicase PcrA